MSCDHGEFDRLMAVLDYPLLIVTTSDGTRNAGCLVGFTSQVSIDPPRFLVGLSDKNQTFRVAVTATVLVVHLVPDAAHDLAELFGGETGDDTDKFTRCRWSPWPEGVPVLSGLENWFAGRIVGRSDFGDHCGFLLEPIEGQVRTSESPLRSRSARMIQPGHEP